jgi:tRNA U34 5-carboxymethylaminomethyl modifying enzyme MnmG/GidA
MSAGRAGEAASTGLTDRLVQLGFETDRLKTGTPARVDRRTINFGGESAQHSQQKLPPACFVVGWRSAFQDRQLSAVFACWC